MSNDLVKRIKDRGDWLVDAVATATQNRQFLRGEPECDDVACEAIRMNGEKAMEVITKPMADRIDELEAKLEEEIQISNKRGNMIEFDLLPKLHEAEAVLREVDAWVDDLGLYAQEGHEPATVFKRVKEVLNK